MLMVLMGTAMRRLLNCFVAVVLASTATGAQAQGSWSGIYIGGNLGWRQADYTSALQGFPGNFVNGKQDGVSAGVHIGAQHQWNQFVFGLEGSLSSTKSFSSTYGDATASQSANCLISAPTLQCQARMGTLLTLGPRLGWAPNDKLMLFVKGGWASAGLGDRVSGAATGNTVGLTNANHRGTFWGGGVEYALTRHIIIGIDYMHVDLNSKFHCDHVAGGCAAGESRVASAEADIVNARLTFKLGGDEQRSAPMK